MSENAKCGDCGNTTSEIVAHDIFTGPVCAACFDDGEVCWYDEEPCMHTEVYKEMYKQER